MVRFLLTEVEDCDKSRTPVRHETFSVRFKILYPPSAS